MTSSRDPEVLADFVQECLAYMPGITQFLDQLPDATLAEETYRHFHSVVGTASMIGLNAFSALAAQMERPLEELTLTGTTHPDRIGLLRQSCQVVANYLERCQQENGADDVADLEALSKDWHALDELVPMPELPKYRDLMMQQMMDEEPIPEPLLPPDIGIPEATEIPLDDVSAELVEVFAMEAEEHLRTITSLLPAIKENPNNKELLQGVRRSAHTLKGSAAMVGFKTITQLAHRMEDLLDLLYEGDAVVTQPIVQLLFETSDALEDMAARKPVGNRLPRLYSQYAEIIQQLGGIVPAVPEERPSSIPSITPLPPVTDTENEEPLDPARRNQNSGNFLRVPIEKLDDLVRLVSELVISRSEFEQRLGGYAQQIDELQLSMARLGRTANKIETNIEAKALGTNRLTGYFDGKLATGPSQQYGFDSLEFDRYTDLHLYTRELGETTTDIRTISNELNNLNREFEGYLTRQTRLSSELQDKLMRVRMVPLATLASRLDRTVRNAATATGKQAKLILQGENTQLDKSVLEEMAEPLLHLLRNAVDHGIESPADRTNYGKADEGIVRVWAATEGTQVVIRIEDDGAGINPEKIRQSAINKGFFTAEEAATLTETQLQQLLFQPGFSTAKDISELSGRGVGLDIVKTQVTRAKGTLSVDSIVGKGTTFTIRLPLTLAVLRALLVRACGQTFAIPLGSVSQILRVEPQHTSMIGDDPVVTLNGKVYPRILLRQALNLRTTDEMPERPPTVIMTVGDQQVAVVFDAIIGGREIVVKNLGSHVRRVRGIAGATLMGDGSVVLIVNPTDLLNITREATSPTSHVKLSRTADTAGGGRHIFVVDDSPSVRRIVTTLLRNNGWEPQAARDGVEALEMLNLGTRPDAILLDVEMPRMDGYEFLSTIRANEAFKHLPVIMVTSRAGDKHRRKAMDLGATAYLVKPFQDEFLLRTLRDLCQPPVTS